MWIKRLFGIGTNSKKIGAIVSYLNSRITPKYSIGDVVRFYHWNMTQSDVIIRDGVISNIKFEPLFFNSRSYGTWLSDGVYGYTIVSDNDSYIIYESNITGLSDKKICFPQTKQNKK